MTFFGRLAMMRENVLGTWGQRAYEEDILQGRLFGHSSFILNTPDAIKHVLVDNYENYTRTPAGFRVLRPVLGEGLLIAEGRAWKHQRRTLAPAFTPRAVATLVPHMVAATDETIAKLKETSGAPVDLRKAMQRMTLEIAGRTMFSFEMSRHGPALRDFVMEYGARLARPHFLDIMLPAEPAGFLPRPLPEALDRFRGHADGRTPRRRQARRRATERSVRPDGCRARSRNRSRLHRRTTRRSGRHDDPCRS
jgi:unspecific monooxygenase